MKKIGKLAAIVCTLSMFPTAALAKEVQKNNKQEVMQKTSENSNFEISDKVITLWCKDYKELLGEVFEENVPTYSKNLVLGDIGILKERATFLKSKSDKKTIDPSAIFDKVSEMLTNAKTEEDVKKIVISIADENISIYQFVIFSDKILEKQEEIFAEKNPEGADFLKNNKKLSIYDHIKKIVNKIKNAVLK